MFEVRTTTVPFSYDWNNQIGISVGWNRHITEQKWLIILFRFCTPSKQETYSIRWMWRTHVPFHIHIHPFIDSLLLKKTHFPFINSVLFILNRQRLAINNGNNSQNAIKNDHFYNLYRTPLKCRHVITIKSINAMVESIDFWLNRWRIQFHNLLWFVVWYVTNYLM